MSALRNVQASCNIEATRNSHGTECATEEHSVPREIACPVPRSPPSTRSQRSPACPSAPSTTSGTAASVLALSRSRSVPSSVGTGPTSKPGSTGRRGRLRREQQERPGGNRGAGPAGGRVGSHCSDRGPRSGVPREVGPHHRRRPGVAPPRPPLPALPTTAHPRRRLRRRTLLRASHRPLRHRPPRRRLLAAARRGDHVNAGDMTTLWAEQQVTSLLPDDVDVPAYGTREWLQLPAGDARKAAALITAAEMWRRYGDEQALLDWFREAHRARPSVADRRTRAELD